MANPDQAKPESPRPPDRAARWTRRAGAAALLAAIILTALLGVRTLTSPDLGYHLAYGDAFWQTGRIVDTNNDFLYTLDAHQPPAERPAPGPGCWYDPQGRYRFPNANWLSQVIMSAVHAAGGVVGLQALQAALVVAMMILAAVTMRRKGLGLAGTAGGVLLATMVATNRFNLRPEVFGYALLATKAALLTSRRLRWPVLVALVLCQLAFVNLHSYFLLGLFMTGARLTEAVARAAWQRLTTTGPIPCDDNPTDDSIIRTCPASAARRLGLVVAAQIAVSFVNPWTWRLAVLPFQTLVFLRQNHIAGATGSIEGHPWAFIAEFFGPFSAGAFLDSKATIAYVVLLAFAGLGLLACLWRRRWGDALVVLGLTVVSLSMRRNIAPAAVVVTPPALANLAAVLASWRRRARARAAGAEGVPSDTASLTRNWPHVASAALAVACLLTSAWFAVSVVTQRFYTEEKRPERFAAGLSPLEVPVEAADWVDTHIPDGDKPARLFCDYNSSSNLYYFVRPHPSLPILTNTWAYPPDTMREVLRVVRGRSSFAAFARRYNLDIAVLRVDLMSSHPQERDVPVVPLLVDRPNWAVVHVDARHVIFLRTDGRYAALAREYAITETSVLRHVDERIERLASQDPAGWHALYVGGTTMIRLGWYRPAERVLAAAIQHKDDFAEAWNQRGYCLVQIGTQKRFAGKADLEAGRDCFRRALAIQPHYPEAQRNLELVERQLRDLAHGRAWTP